MGFEASHSLRRVVLAMYLSVGLFLVAHSINAFVAESLYLPATTVPGSAAGGAAASVSVPSYQQAIDHIRSSGLFVLPPSVMGIDTGNVSVPARASLGVAAKLRLIGVVVGDQQGTFAIVEELTSKRHMLYRLHAQIPDVGEVSEIRRDGIVVRSGELQELLELATTDKPASTAPVAGAAPPPPASGAPLRKVIDRREVEQAMADLPKLLSQARAVPYLVNGAPSGYRMDYIAPASFYEKIGIQYGDVLQRVNGVDVRDPSTMLSLFQQLKNERTVKVDMVRNNQRVTVTYDLR
ncbi:MAG: hypothetical protein RI101_05930 [Nitrospira sp.]|jgi:general secretion pathway protein C|nr:hypothetical protein [Nitrospira sp.]